MVYCTSGQLKVCVDKYLISGGDQVPMVCQHKEITPVATARLHMCVCHMTDGYHDDYIHIYMYLKNFL